VSYRSLIAVAAYRLAPDRVPRWHEGGYGVPAAYLEALRRADARAAIISPGEDGDATELLDPFDGLLLVGGGDVDPALFGAAPGANDYGVDRARDDFEIALLRAADELYMPTLCICRGAQVMNVAFGGTLHQHLPDVDGMLEHGVPVEGTRTFHDVEPVRHTRLSATTKTPALRCSSHHHQGIDRVADGVDVSGRSPDGLVEAIERGKLDMNAADAGWMIGVQWHPEDTAADDPSQQALFDALALLARIRGVHARPGEARGRSRSYEIVEPNPDWPRRFDRVAAELRDAIAPGLVVSIEHMGSTSVPGLGAKDVIDISLGLTTLIPREAYLTPLRDLGYRHALDPWNDDHEFFSRDTDVDVHVHVCLAGGEFESRHLAFRDWLRAHPDDARAYEALKRDLAARHPNDIASYVEGKSEFVAGIEAQALAEAPTGLGGGD
jgi:putative glutamine amidotransferase